MERFSIDVCGCCQQEYCVCVVGIPTPAGQHPSADDYGMWCFSHHQWLYPPAGYRRRPPRCSCCGDDAQWCDCDFYFLPDEIQDYGRTRHFCWIHGYFYW